MAFFGLRLSLSLFLCVYLSIWGCTFYCFTSIPFHSIPSFWKCLFAFFFASSVPFFYCYWDLIFLCYSLVSIGIRALQFLFFRWQINLLNALMLYKERECVFQSVCAAAAGAVVIVVDDGLFCFMYSAYNLCCILYMCVYNCKMFYVLSFDTRCYCCRCANESVHINGDQSAQNNEESPYEKFKRCTFMMNIVWHFIWKQIICYINDEPKAKTRMTNLYSMQCTKRMIVRFFPHSLLCLWNIYRMDDTGKWWKTTTIQIKMR